MKEPRNLKEQLYQQHIVLGIYDLGKTLHCHQALLRHTAQKQAVLPSVRLPSVKFRSQDGATLAFLCGAFRFIFLYYIWIYYLKMRPIGPHKVYDHAVNWSPKNRSFENQSQSKQFDAWNRSTAAHWAAPFSKPFANRPFKKPIPIKTASCLERIGCNHFFLECSGSMTEPRRRNFEPEEYFYSIHW